MVNIYYEKTDLSGYAAEYKVDYRPEYVIDPRTFERTRYMNRKLLWEAQRVWIEEDNGHVWFYKNEVDIDGRDAIVDMQEFFWIKLKV